MHPNDLVVFQQPDDTPWWCFFRRSHERSLLKCLSEVLGTGPFRIERVEGDIVWIKTRHGSRDFGKRWLRKLGGGEGLLGEMMDWVTK